MRLHPFKPVVIGVAGIGLSVTVLAADTILEGRWQYTSTMQMDGMPQMPQGMPKMPEGMQMPPGVKMPAMGAGGMTSTFESCVTNNNPVPQNKDRERNCKVTKMTRDGNHFSWTSSCQLPDGGTAESEGEGSYSGDSSQVTIKTKAVHDGHPMNMTMNVTGKYLGPCQ